MRVLQLHNQYRAYGGEDAVADLERNLLLEHGHNVERLAVSNKSIEKATLRTGLETIWSQRSHRMVRDTLRGFRPDVLHVHNTFPQLSPSVYWAAKSEGVPVIQTLHNYRLTCVNALLLRDGAPCELCVGRRLSWPGIRHKCYRDSAPASAAIAAMQGAHRAVGTYRSKVDAYITVTEFARSVMVRSGLPKELVHVKPNFVPDPMPDIGELPAREDKLAFVGRLSGEKGADLLLEAWKRLGRSEFRLVVVGDGPERGKLETLARKLPGLEWRGWMAQREALREVASSRHLVVPSRTYEGFPMVVAEAMSVGTPVIAANHAGFPEIVGRAGLLFEPGDPDDLAKKMSEASLLGEGSWRQMSGRARSDYLSRYTPEKNHGLLMGIYDSAIEHAGGR